MTLDVVKTPLDVIETPREDPGCRFIRFFFTSFSLGLLIIFNNNSHPTFLTMKLKFFAIATLLLATHPVTARLLGAPRSLAKVRMPRVLPRESRIR